MDKIYIWQLYQKKIKVNVRSLAETTRQYIFPFLTYKRFKCVTL